MRTIGVVTVARSDYGIYCPLLRRILADPDLQLHLIVAGMNLSPDFGLTVKAVEADGFEIGERVEMLLSSDTPEGIACQVYGYGYDWLRTGVQSLSTGYAGCVGRPFRDARCKPLQHCPSRSRLPIFMVVKLHRELLMMLYDTQLQNLATFILFRQKNMQVA